MILRWVQDGMGIIEEYAGGCRIKLKGDGSIK